MRVLPSLALLWLASGCNAVLGIDEPQSARDTIILDAGLDGDVEPPEPDASLTDAGPLPPTPYARAAWPMPNEADAGLPHPQTYAQEEPGLVRDEVTGLTWQVEMEGEPLTFAEATSYCKKLSLAGGGFRLPSRIELTSLLDLREASPAIDKAAFPETIGDKLWSASAYAGASNQRWLVNFGFGTGLVFSAGIGEKHYARCVRSAGEPETPDFELGAETVTDPATQLTWQRSVETAPVTISAAAAACAALTFDGGGFRLPTVKELHTLVDERRFKTAIDPEVFPDTPSAYFWTASKVAGFAKYTWMVSFTDGSDRWVAEDVTGLVRCVR